MVKGVSKYSDIWRRVKYRPRAMVVDKAWVMCFRWPSIRLWCAQVIETPEASRTAVFNSGTSSGLSGLMPVGGQQPPSSGVGARLEW